MFVGKYMGENGLDAMLATKKPVGVAQDMNLLKQIYISHTPQPCVNKTTHSYFETQRRRHHKPKTVVSVAQQKGLMSSKLFLKKCLD